MARIERIRKPFKLDANESTVISFEIEQDENFEMIEKMLIRIRANYICYVRINYFQYALWKCCEWRSLYKMMQMHTIKQ